MEDHSSNSYFERFVKQILLHSVSQEKDIAINEWYLCRVEKYPIQNRCICGHSIKYNFYIRNRNIGIEIVVGSVYTKNLDDSCNLKKQYKQYVSIESREKLYKKEFKKMEKKYENEGLKLFNICVRDALVFI